MQTLHPDVFEGLRGRTLWQKTTIHLASSSPDSYDCIGWGHAPVQGIYRLRDEASWVA
jgi:hypothetical protein